MGNKFVKPVFSKDCLCKEAYDCKVEVSVCDLFVITRLMEISGITDVDDTYKKALERYEKLNKLQECIVDEVAAARKSKFDPTSLHTRSFSVGEILRIYGFKVTESDVVDTKEDSAKRRKLDSVYKIAPPVKWECEELYPHYSRYEMIWVNKSCVCHNIFGIPVFAIIYSTEKTSGLDNDYKGSFSVCVYGKDDWPWVLEKIKNKRKDAETSICQNPIIRMKQNMDRSMNPNKLNPAMDLGFVLSLMKNQKELDVLFDQEVEEFVRKFGKINVQKLKDNRCSGCGEDMESMEDLCFDCKQKPICEECGTRILYGINCPNKKCREHTIL